MRFFRTMVAMLAIAWTGTALGSDPHTGRDEGISNNYGYAAYNELYQLTVQFPNDATLQTAYVDTYTAYTQIWEVWNVLFDSTLEGWTTQAQYEYGLSQAYQATYTAAQAAYSAWVNDQTAARTQMYDDAYNMYYYAYLATQQSAPPTPTVFYSAGTTGSAPVLGNVQVIPIYWGGYWNTVSGVGLTASIDSFYDSILTSTYMSLMGEYSTYDASHNYITRIGNGSRASPILITNSEPPVGIGAGDLGNQIVAWINAGLVPPTTSNTFYVVYMTPHSNSSSVVSGNKSGNPVPPLVFAGMSQSTSATLDDYTTPSSRLLANAVTNPIGGAWANSSGTPAGDVGSANSSPTQLNGYLVTQIWSNLHGGPAIAPRN
jgi:hypothetical protein